VAQAVQAWIKAVGAKTACIAPGSPWENGYVESSNARLRDELLNGEIFHSLREAEIVIESWKRHHNTVRPHASPGHQPPAPDVLIPALAAWPAASRPALPAKLTVAPQPKPNQHPPRATKRGRSLLANQSIAVHSARSGRHSSRSSVKPKRAAQSFSVASSATTGRRRIALATRRFV
jgi:hypothetical protein